MTIDEAAVIAICGAIGFGVVSWFISRKSADEPNNSRNNSEARSRSSDPNERSNRSEANHSREWYEVLEVDKNAGLETISKAYYERMKKYHPDHVGHLGDEFRSIAELKSRD